MRLIIFRGKTESTLLRTRIITLHWKLSNGSEKATLEIKKKPTKNNTEYREQDCKKKNIYIFLLNYKT